MNEARLKELIVAEVRAQLAPLFEQFRELQELCQRTAQKVEQTRDLAAALNRVFVDPEEKAPTRQ